MGSLPQLTATEHFRLKQVRVFIRRVRKFLKYLVIDEYGDQEKAGRDGHHIVQCLTAGADVYEVVQRSGASVEVEKKRRKAKCSEPQNFRSDKVHDVLIKADTVLVGIRKKGHDSARYVILK